MSSTQEVGDIFGAGKGPAQAMLRSPTVLIVSIGLWGMDLFFYKLFNIDYRYVLQFDLMEMEQEEERERRRSKKRRRRGKKEDDDSGVAIASSHETTTTKHMSPSSQLELADISKRKTVGSNLSTDISPASGSSEDDDNVMGLEDGILKESEESIHANSAALELQQLQHQMSSEPQNYGMTITWFKLVVFSVVLLFLLHFTTHFWMDHLGRSSIGAVFSFYASVAIYIFLPLPSNGWLRRSFVLILQRSFELINPRCSCIFLDANKSPRMIPFVDVFYADAMCSLSKVFFDWGLLLHQASHWPDPVPSDFHNIILPSLCAAVPYLIRARQCLIMHTYGKCKNDPMRYQHLMNAFKYSTSIFPLLLSAYQKTISPETAQQWEGVLIALLVINASYSLYWDIVMDWGMMQDPYKVAQTVVGCKPTGNLYMPTAQNDGIIMDISTAKVTGVNAQDGANGNSTIIPTADNMHSDTATSSTSLPPTPSNKGHDNDAYFYPNSTHGHAHTAVDCHHVCLRPRLRFGFVLSTLIVVADSILRFSWTLRFIAKFPSNDAFVLCTQFLEVFRRAIWNLLRVEWENIKIQQKTKSQMGGKGGSGGHDDNDEVKPLMMRRSNLRKTGGGGTTSGGGALEMKSLL